nr:hypothetical protein Itr_chr03CG17350 [Ipomoea trifida]
MMNFPEHGNYRQHMASDCSSAGIEIRLGNGGGKRMRAAAQPHTAALFTAVGVGDNMYSIELGSGTWESESESERVCQMRVGSCHVCTLKSVVKITVKILKSSKP